ncbi:hypothetical protein EGC86_14230 [Shewanella frigidimarina]|mgnify:FL=1|uniref:hypothetical protein n=1 Tax=Shewanella frigidimarina TaxID=56812 RepID=UPI000F4FA44D|nr:hypothetical protein [Shewanella frigidimarina]RPA60229.1 hypothetical protein EGC86_14230 [Shewanella frigidimarina]
MYKLIAIILLLFISTPSMGSSDEENLTQRLAAAKKIDRSEPNALCKASVDVVRHQDVNLFRKVFAAIPATDEQVKVYLSELHDKYFKTSYLGIDNYQIDENEALAFEDAKNSSSSLVSDNAKQRGHDLELWVPYRFDTISPKTNEAIQGYGTCKLAYLENQWKVVTLL